MSNILAVVIFLIFALAIVFSGHYFIYFSLIRFFKLNLFSVKISLALLLLILPASFIISSFLSHYYDNILTRGYYYLSGLWLGVALNLILAFALAWLAIMASKLFGFQVSYYLLGMLALLLAIGVSLYGVQRAYAEKVVTIDADIGNIPAAWKGRTAVQLTDAHLGHVLGAKFLQGVVDKVNTLKPDIVFITGDLFDGMDGHLEGLAAPFNNLKAPLGIYFVSGNHESYLGWDRAKAALSNTPVKILNDEMIKIDGLQIIGVSYPERSFSKDIKKTIESITGFNPAEPSVLLWHSPTQIPAIKSTGVNLMLAGHAHHGQLWPIQLISRLVYGPYYYGLHREGTFSEYTSAGIGVWGPSMRTGADPEITVIKF